jgi:hypothetical protein
LQVYVGTAMEINQVSICVRGYQAGAVTTRAALRELAARALSEFGLAGEID